MSKIPLFFKSMYEVSITILSNLSKDKASERWGGEFMKAYIRQRKQGSGEREANDITGEITGVEEIY